MVIYIVWLLAERAALLVTSNATLLTVQQAPVITVQPSSPTVCGGQRVTPNYCSGDRVDVSMAERMELR